MEKYYRFAGVEVAVDIPEKWMYSDDRQLSPFRVSQVQQPHTFCFEPVDSLPEPSGYMAAFLPGVRVYCEGDKLVRYIGTVDEGWEKAYIRAEYGKDKSLVQVKVSEPITHIGVKTVLNSLGAEHLVAEAGGFVFHCAYIVWNGAAILFTAPSGTGKSTQAELWKKYRDAEIINGDRAAVCAKDGLMIAEGIPFSGSSSYCANRSLPLAAIVYLSQAPHTTIRKLGGMEAFFKIWERGSVNSWVKEDVEHVVNVVQKAVEEIPVYHLACTPDESAVAVLEDALRKQGFI